MSKDVPFSLKIRTLHLGERAVGAAEDRRATIGKNAPTAPAMMNAPKRLSSIWLPRSSVMGKIITVAADKRNSWHFDPQTSAACPRPSTDVQLF
jgi:hypothetical protein